MNHSVSPPTSHSLQDQLIQLISPWVTSLGYQIIYVEVLFHRQKILRIYIDYLNPSSEKNIGIEDCVKVSHTLNETLDQLPELQTLLPGTYELEVSSPGVDRPLRAATDFQRFAGHEVRIHVYRPMTSEELENQDYQAKNPKQKHFLGTLLGISNEKVTLLISKSQSTKKTKNTQRLAKKKKLQNQNEIQPNPEEGIQVTIPLPLISKANLEPQFNFEERDERE